METNVDRIQIYEDDGGGFRWRALAGNGEIVSEGESHTRMEDAARAAKGVFGREMPVEEVTDGPA